MQEDETNFDVSSTFTGFGFAATYEAGSNHNQAKEQSEQFFHFKNSFKFFYVK
jgi:hypothetical protein